MRLFPALLLAASAAFSSASADFSVGQGSFLIDNKPVVIKAAELHYPRIPRPYWKHRIQMCKALGMNTICLYVFWNAHESFPGEFDFSGQLDLREFIRLCDSEGMMVILRPGPYVCAEWEMGGLPWWLLEEKEMRLREDDPAFLEHVARFEREVASQVADLTAEHGGPIVMVQVENEYGSYGKNKAYVSSIRDMLRELYGDTEMFQCDWSSNFLDNGLDDLLWTLNFGTGADIDAQFEPLRKVRPDSPLMCSEYWSGWFDKWGANHETRPAVDMITGIDEMLSKGISFSLYMTHGGTNWGHWAGANSPGYEPDVTSYDYDAPINEQGSPTPKYHALRALLARHNEEELPPVPDTIPVISIPQFALTEVAPLFSNLPEASADSLPRNMEAYGQGFGSILYSTLLPDMVEGSTLRIEEAHDWTQVFIDGKLAGILDRRLAQKELRLPATRRGARLDILVEAMGRINFGRAIKDFKGIASEVRLSNAQGDTIPLSCWDITPIPDEYELYSAMRFEPVGEADAEGRLPRGVYRGTFNVTSPSDTYLNFETWGKGLVYVNGHPLGRIWEIGPQLTLYTPGCWLREGENEILVLDILGPTATTVSGLTTPIIDRVRNSATNHRWESVDTSRLTPVAEGSFSSGAGWQQVDFNSAQKGRYLCLEAIDAVDGSESVAVAELQLIDAQGNRISREAWSVAYADSELTSSGNHGAEKVYDLQESTYWMTTPGSGLPHRLVIDLGSEQQVSGLQYLPRMEAGTPGAICHYRIFLWN